MEGLILTLDTATIYARLVGLEVEVYTMHLGLRNEAPAPEANLRGGCCGPAYKPRSV